MDCTIGPDTDREALIAELAEDEEVRERLDEMGVCEPEFFSWVRVRLTAPFALAHLGHSVYWSLKPIAVGWEGRTFCRLCGIEVGRQGNADVERAWGPAFDGPGTGSRQ